MTTIRYWIRTARKELKRRWAPPRAVPTALTDPDEAIERFRRGEIVAVSCPIDGCVMFNGLTFAAKGYHPFMAASAEMLAQAGQRYPGSCLESYYAKWQPTDALDALIASLDGPQILRRYPAYLMPEPWSTISMDERRAFVEQTMRWESAGITGRALTPHDGHGLQGPVTPRKGQAEFRRLQRALKSIVRKGFERRYGDITAQVLKRDTEIRYRIIHGHHRAGILAAMKHDQIVIQPSQVIDLHRVREWPQVKNGSWSRAQAEGYFNHHFDFDSGAWARARGLRS